MSRTPLYWIEKKNTETGEWEDVNVYVKNGDEYKPYERDTGNADYNLFKLLFEKLDGAHRRIPNDLAPAARKFFDETVNEWTGEVGNMRRDAETALFDLVELRLLNKTKDVIVYNEWYEEDPDELEYSDEPKYTNGLEDFVRIVEFICDANGIWYPNPGEVRIICAII